MQYAVLNVRVVCLYRLCLCKCAGTFLRRFQSHQIVCQGRQSIQLQAGAMESHQRYDRALLSFVYFLPGYLEFLAGMTLGRSTDATWAALALTLQINVDVGTKIRNLCSGIMAEFGKLANLC